MPKLSPEKLNPGRDAAVRRILAAWPQRRLPSAVVGSDMRKAPKEGKAQEKTVSSPLHIRQ